MSFDPVLWAMKDAPVANVEEWAILACLAEHADDDGCNAMPSQATIAKRTKTSPATVKRRIADLEQRRIIQRGDQSIAERYPADRRPVVWDLMIPFAWFPSIDRIQEHRADKGRPPLRQGDRPKLQPAPEKPRRVDHGKPKADRSTSATALQEPPLSVSDGATSSQRGVSQFGTGGLPDPQPSPLTLTGNPPPLFVVSADADPTEEADAKAEDEPAKTPSTAQGHRLPENFTPSQAMQDWARVHAPLVGWDQHQEFVDHWIAQPGIKGRKTNWVATWRNWMRKAQRDIEAAQRRGGRRVSGSPRPHNSDIPEGW